MYQKSKLDQHHDQKTAISPATYSNLHYSAGEPIIQNNFQNENQFTRFEIQPYQKVSQTFIDDDNGHHPQKDNAIVSNTSLNLFQNLSGMEGQGSSEIQVYRPPDYSQQLQPSVSYPISVQENQSYAVDDVKRVQQDELMREQNNVSSANISAYHVTIPSPSSIPSPTAQNDRLPQRSLNPQIKKTEIVQNLQQQSSPLRNKSTGNLQSGSKSKLNLTQTRKEIIQSVAKNQHQNSHESLHSLNQDLSVDHLSNEHQRASTGSPLRVVNTQIQQQKPAQEVVLDSSEIQPLRSSAKNRRKKQLQDIEKNLATRDTHYKRKIQDLLAQKHALKVKSPPQIVNSSAKILPPADCQNLDNFYTHARQPGYNMPNSQEIGNSMIQITANDNS